MSPREQLVRQVVALGQLDPLVPEAAARTLGATLGPAQQVSKYRVEYGLTGSELLAEGTIIRNSAGTSVILKPAPGTGLLLQDVEPALLDCPYVMKPQTGHFKDGLRVRAIDHFFAVPAGMIVVKVPPPAKQESYEAALRSSYEEGVDNAAAPGVARHEVDLISVTTNARQDLEGALTLRAFREWATGK